MIISIHGHMCGTTVVHLRVKHERADDVPKTVTDKR